MINSEEFQRLAGWIGRFNSGVGLVREEQASTRTLVDSAEYELELLRRQLSGTRPPVSRPAPEIPRAGGNGAFNTKLRRPENPTNPQWWAVLGLNQRF